MDFDLIIIGSGNAAMVSAFQIRAAGWSVAIVDEKPFGGTCALRAVTRRKCSLLEPRWLKARGECKDVVSPGM